MCLHLLFALGPFPETLNIYVCIFVCIYLSINIYAHTHNFHQFHGGVNKQSSVRCCVRSPESQRDFIVGARDWGFMYWPRFSSE